MHVSATCIYMCAVSCVCVYVYCCKSCTCWRVSAHVGMKEAQLTHQKQHTRYPKADE